MHSLNGPAVKERRLSRLVLTCVFPLFLSAAVVGCAEPGNKYVRAGAAGSANGSDWTNAYPTLPSSLTRGSTYYVADGSYGSYTFDDAASGATYITIRKATAADHGTDIGWSSGFGDEAATFGGIEFTTKYWIFDGVVGGGPGSWTNGFGFRVARTSSYPVVFVNGGGSVTLRHVEIQGAGDNGAPGGTGNDSLQVFGGNGPVTLSYAYLHNAGRCHFYHGGGSTSPLTAEYTYTGRYESVDAEHAELAVLRSSALFVFRWGVVTHEEGTGGFIAGDNGPTTAEIYGNVFYSSGEFGEWASENNGLFAAFTSGSAARQWKVHNNTFINLPSLLSVFNGGASPQGNVASNNYFYNSPGHDVGGWGMQSFGHFQNSDKATGASGTTGSGIPFVNYAGYDFNLTAATAPGQTLAPPYNVDMFGTVRGSDGTWDRGAIEFTAGDRGQRTSQPGSRQTAAGTVRPPGPSEPSRMRPATPAPGEAAPAAAPRPPEGSAVLPPAVREPVRKRG